MPVVTIDTGSFTLRKLAWLYRKRYEGLELVNKIRQAIRKGEQQEMICSLIREEYQHKIQVYLIEEAAWVFPFLSKESRIRKSVEAQHIVIAEKAVNGCVHNPAPPGLSEEFADLLEENIRFEIRILFPMVERAVKKNHLADLM